MQGLLTQTSYSTELPLHSIPPQSGFGLSHARVRLRKPLSHVAEHSDQELHDDHLPSIWQHCVLHSLSSSRVVLQYLFVVDSLRVFLLIPDPHGREQADQSDHWLVSQLQSDIHDSVSSTLSLQTVVSAEEAFLDRYLNPFIIQSELHTDHELQFEYEQFSLVNKITK